MQQRTRPTFFVRLLRFLLILAAVLFAAIYIYRSIAPRQALYATVELGTIGKSYSGNALIVRSEAVYDDEGVISIEYEAQEARPITRSGVVCKVYSTGYSKKELTSLQDFRDQIKAYQRTLLKSETAYDQRMQRLESDVISRGLEVRRLVQGEAGNLTNQEQMLDNAIVARQNYFKSKYSEDQRLTRLYDDEATQQQRIDSWIKARTAAMDSIVSFYTDGYEYALTPLTYEQFSPADVRAMIGGKKPEKTTAQRGRTDIYRLVKDEPWYALMLISDPTWNPVQGETYSLMLEQFANSASAATVVSFARAGSELLVRLRVDSGVQNVLYMRACQAKLGDYTAALVVPNRAVLTQAGSKGVVVIRSEGQFFVPISIVSSDEENTYFTLVMTDSLNVGQTVRLF